MSATAHIRRLGAGMKSPQTASNGLTHALMEVSMHGTALEIPALAADSTSDKELAARAAAGEPQRPDRVPAPLAVAAAAAVRPGRARDAGGIGPRARHPPALAGPAGNQRRGRLRDCRRRAALARGANAVAIGRPVLFSLALGGWMGVKSAYERIAAELSRDMLIAGAARVADIDRRFLIPSAGPVR